MKAKELQKQLTFEYSDFTENHAAETEKACAFAEGYKAFLAKAKTEREFHAAATEFLNEAGYRPFEPGKKYRSGDKVFFNNRDKALIMTTFGRRPISDGLRMTAAHIDSPRLDVTRLPPFGPDALRDFHPAYSGGTRT